MEKDTFSSRGEAAVDCKKSAVRYSTQDFKSVLCIQGLAGEEEPSGEKILMKTNSYFLGTWASFWSSPSCPRVGQQWKFPQYTTL